MDRSPDEALRGLQQTTENIAIALSDVFVALGAREQECPKHGAYTATGTRLSKGREVWTRCPGCTADDAAAEKARKEAREAEYARADMEARLDQTAIPPRFVGKTLGSFNAETDQQRHALTVAREYLEDFPQHLKRGEGLIFSGMPGTGKSHVAGGILQGLLPKHVGLYITCMGLIRSVRGTWRKDSERSESDVLATLLNVPLLVVDEIGVQYGTDGEQTILFDVLDGRYRNMKPTILLTNQDKAGLKAFIGERAYDRLTETSRWIPFDWPSYRLQAKREASQ
jgi:DNA replication protein DnaC